MIVRTALRIPLAVAVVLGGSVLAVAVVARTVDGSALALAAENLVGNPLAGIAAMTAFACAFAVRAAAWSRVLPDLTLGHAWSGIHLALAGNHLLPFRLGEPLRILSVVRRANVSPSDATASTMTLRSADVLAVMALGLITGGARLPSMPMPILVAAGAAVLAVGVAGLVWTRRLRRMASTLRWPGPLALSATGAAWLCEATLVWVVANAAGIEIGYLDAVFVTAVSVAAQVVAVLPGGFGTYEAAAVAAYVGLGHDPGAALAAALAAHALKTLYSLAGGAIATFAPSPTMLGRLRLPSDLPRRPAVRTIDAHQPIVVVFPAHDEADTVARVVRRVPDAVRGHPVTVIVVDDGSTDPTADRARSAGAEVVSLTPNRGLGAAVRHGFARSLAHDPAAVVFLDADGEYAPEELERMVTPILSGDADYVVGSRFAGHITRMLPHRRLGNRVLTRMLSIVARRRIDDGQSGYRALSRSAVESAEIVHDYNYAQVLTLDLLRKGFLYAEVPISYHFRTTGRSFIRLGRYLRAVLPAIHRELNAGRAG